MILLYLHIIANVLEYMKKPIKNQISEKKIFLGWGSNPQKITLVKDKKSKCTSLKMNGFYLLNFVETRFGHNFFLLFDQNSSGTETHPLTQMLLYMIEQPLGS